MKLACLVLCHLTAIGHGFLLPPTPKHTLQTFLPPQPNTTPHPKHTHHHSTPTPTTPPPEPPPTPSQTIHLYNSLTGTKQPLTPLLPGQISMYTCGPTVYDYAHVGNFRAFLTYDVLKRVLQYFGLSVTHVCNLTDVDDKIIARCTREGVSLKELTGRFERLFMEDLAALNVRFADVYPRATEHIEEMVEMIEELERVGLAYQSKEGSWYFRVDEKEGYGKQLVDLDLGKGRGGGGGEGDTPVAAGCGCCGGGEPEAAALDADEYDAEKVGVRDFALWKAYKPGVDREDAIWDTSIGNGRPGWHLECSAMAKKYFGASIDIHCGGVDLKFPHHENEIAQSEGANGGKKFSNFWVHNGFVNIGDEKMSKSKGNFLTLRGACPTADNVRAYRYLIVSSQYRNPLSFTAEAVAGAKGALRRIDNVRKMLNDALEKGDSDTVSKEDETNNDIVEAVNSQLNNFETALADDLSMPRAAASLFGVVKAAETEFKRWKKVQKRIEDGDEELGASPPLDLVGLRAVSNAIDRMDEVFGIFYQVPKVKNENGTEDEDEDGADDDTIPDEVMELVNSRTAAKVAKDWELADSLRSRITDLGFAVKDVKDGDAIVSRAAK